MQREDEGHRLARFHVARVIEEIGAARLHLDDVAFVDDAVGWAVGVGTVQSRRRDARRAGEPERILGARGGRAHEQQAGCENESSLRHGQLSSARRSRANASSISP